MLLGSIIFLVLSWTFFVMVDSNGFNTGEITEFHEPNYCAVDEYFNVNQLKCITCDSDKNLVPSSDGLSCVCNDRSKIHKWNFASFPVCLSCKENEIPTRDKLDCIPCPLSQNENASVCEDFRCPPNTVLVEREPTGRLASKPTCLKCEPGTEASLTQTICRPCKEALVSGKKNKCTCQEGEFDVDGVCFKGALKNWPDEKTMNTITYENGKEVDSQFLRDNFLHGMFFCKMGNQTMCQLVANMCVTVMYDEARPLGPCSMFRDRKRIPTSDADVLPWLYYGEGDAPTVLSRKRISVQFNLDQNSHLSFLNLTGIFYNPDGSFKEIKRITGHTLQLCPASWKSLDSSFRFAAKYFYACHIPAKQLLDARETEFIDLFFSYKEENKELLYALPVLVLNLKHEGFYKNKESDQLHWQLVRRIFLLDKLSGLSFEEDQNSNKKKISEVVRFARSITLNVKLQGNEDDGKIFVPYLTIEYGEITREEIEKNSLISLSFKVDYQMENSLSHALEWNLVPHSLIKEELRGSFFLISTLTCITFLSLLISNSVLIGDNQTNLNICEEEDVVCMGVFSGLAVVWSGIQTWSNSKRSGRLTIDFVTITQLMLFTCGNLANVFFLVVCCASLHFFLFFKGESAVHILLPTESQEEVIKLYLIFAFLLKVIDIVRLIYNQITVDIFFIDWERPRARNLISRKSGTGIKGSENDKEQPVSIWRTYFVANEWNEIQTKRKINVNIHLLVTVFILKVVGLEFWATSDPDLHYKMPPETIGKEFSFTCWFTTGAFVYITVYIIQRLFVALIYERFVKNGIQEFVDICSVANISVFILAFENYGYYIHGRSAHGFADTDMQSIINQLLREEEDLVGHRGLLPETDQQTFEMTVPTQLRAYYKKVMAPLRNMSKISKRITISTVSGRSKMGSENLDKSVQAYHNMNRFLAAYLEHALKDLDYEVRDKLFTETLLGIEFADPSEKGIFYSDNGHSFDNVLFYGNEFSLFTFDIMLFSFIIVLSEDYLVAGIVTTALSYIVTLIKDVGGRKNLAKKTLIDERFLI